MSANEGVAATGPSAQGARHAGFYALTLGAVGVVFGDIGTSPIYALREALANAHGAAATATVLGVCSLIFWALVAIVTLKYVVIVMRADNGGEGGTLALMALAQHAIGRRSAIVFFLGVSRTIGWDFYMQGNAAWWNYSWGYTDQVPPLPVWPNPAMLAIFLTNNKLIQVVVMLLMAFWWFGWAGTLFLSSTRVVFAAAFDRLLPERVAELDERTGTPVNAMFLMVVPAVIVSFLYAYNVGGFISVTLAATQAIAIMYFGTAIAAIILPYKKKELFEASPIAKMKIFGIPVISVAGVIFAIFLAARGAGSN